VRAYRAAFTFPSTPRAPKPGQTRMPSTPASLFATPPSSSASSSSESSFTIRTRQPAAIPPWRSASTMLT